MKPSGHRANCKYGSDLPIQGAVADANGVIFTIWAATHSQMSVSILDADGAVQKTVPLAAIGNGFFSGRVPEARVGTLYKYSSGDQLIPDVVSRFQPQGVHGPSEVIDPSEYRWEHDAIKRPGLADLVIYELHIGTFTTEGTFRAAIEKLPHIAALGANAIEIMPVADFAGDRNWGYDGVMLYAPARTYGRPEDLRELIDLAHALEMAVIMDVVYNHLGPDGNYLRSFSPHYFHSSSQTPWGEALNFDSEPCKPARDFFIRNAANWMDEFHVDGLRLDAIHAIEDKSKPHVLEEITAAVHDRGGFVIGEDDRNLDRLIVPRSEGGYGLDGLWADDFHHVVRVAVHPERVGHFKSYTGTTRELADTLQHGWLFRGQNFPMWDRPRGTACDHCRPDQFVFCISNHDQVGNRPLGERLHLLTSPEAYRAASALLCLQPYTPMLFMGQEWGASSPFCFFSDHSGEIGRNITKGRRMEFQKSSAHYPDEVLEKMPDPQSLQTFNDSKLRWDEIDRPEHAPLLRLYQTCLKLRLTDPTLKRRARENWEVQALDEEVVALRYLGQGDERLLLFCPAPGPVRPRTLDSFGPGWKLLLSTNESRFGGDGRPAFDGEKTVTFTRPETLLLQRTA